MWGNVKTNSYNTEILQFKNCNKYGPLIADSKILVLLEEKVQ